MRNCILIISAGAIAILANLGLDALLGELSSRCRDKSISRHLSQLETTPPPISGFLYFLVKVKISLLSDPRRKLHLDIKHHKGLNMRGSLL
ncbi:MAG: hypothetical protein ACYTX0_34585 [Nostoc sp.]